MLRKNDQNMFNASNAMKNERFSFENKYANTTVFLFYLSREQNCFRLE